MPDEMTREQFTKVCTAIAQAAQLLPALDYETAHDLAMRIHTKIWREGKHYSNQTRARIMAIADLIEAAGKFKSAADHVYEIGVTPQEIPLEKVMTPDDRPEILRAADRPQAPRPGPGEDPGS